jgi:hypothetical protein
MYYFINDFPDKNKLFSSLWIDEINQLISLVVYPADLYGPNPPPSLTTLRSLFDPNAIPSILLKDLANETIYYFTYAKCSNEVLSELITNVLKKFLESCEKNIIPIDFDETIVIPQIINSFNLYTKTGREAPYSTHHVIAKYDSQEGSNIHPLIETQNVLQRIRDDLDNNTVAPRRIKIKLSVQPLPGETLLHSMINASTDFNDLVDFFSTTDQKQLSKMARTVDDKGKLALDLIAEKIFWSQADKARLRHILLNLILAHPFKPISTPMKIDKMVNRYQITHDSELYKNLEIGCEVGNKVRKKFYASTTHAEANFYSYCHYQSTLEQLIDIRAADEVSELKLADFSLRNDQTRYTCLRARISTKTGIGNCWEFTNECIRILEEEYNISADSFFLDPGDHTFPVFGAMDAKVILDAHKGKIFPYAQFSQELKCHHPRYLITEFQSLKLNYPAIKYPMININTFFNPSYHKNPQVMTTLPNNFLSKLKDKTKLLSP